METENFIHPALPEGNQRKLTILYRDIWKKKLGPELGKLWSLYKQVGEEYASFELHLEAIEYGFEPSLQYALFLPPNESHSLRKQLDALLKICQSLNEMRQFKKSCSLLESKVLPLLKQLERKGYDERNMKFKWKYLISCLNVSYELAQVNDFERYFDESLEFLEQEEMEEIEVIEKRRELVSLLVDLKEENKNDWLLKQFELLFKFYLCQKDFETLSTLEKKSLSHFNNEIFLLEFWQQSKTVDQEMKSYKLESMAKLYERLLDYEKTLSCLFELKEINSDALVDHFIENALKCQQLYEQIKQSSDVKFQYQAFNELETLSMNGGWLFSKQMTPLLKKIIDNEPDNKEMIKQLAIRLELQQQSNESLGYFEKYLQLKPDVNDPQFYFHYGNALESNQSDYETVEKIYLIGLEVTKEKDYETKLLIYENLEYLGLRRGEINKARQYRLEILKLENLMELEKEELPLYKVITTEPEAEKEPPEVMEIVEEEKVPEKKKISHHLVLKIIWKNQEIYQTTIENINELKETLISKYIQSITELKHKYLGVFQLNEIQIHQETHKDLFFKQTTDCSLIICHTEILKPLPFEQQVEILFQKKKEYVKKFNGQFPNIEYYNLNHCHSGFALASLYYHAYEKGNRKIIFKNCHLKENLLSDFLNGLEFYDLNLKHFHTLDFSGNALTRECFQLISSHFQKSKHESEVTKLDFSGSRLLSLFENDLEVIKQIFQHSSLEHIGLRNCFLVNEEAAYKLFDILKENKNLKSIDWHNNVQIPDCFSFRLLK